MSVQSPELPARSRKIPNHAKVYLFNWPVPALGAPHLHWGSNRSITHQDTRVNPRPVARIPPKSGRVSVWPVARPMGLEAISLRLKKTKMTKIGIGLISRPVEVQISQVVKPF